MFRGAHNWQRDLGEAPTVSATCHSFLHQTLELATPALLGHYYMCVNWVTAGSEWQQFSAWLKVVGKEQLSCSRQERCFYLSLDEETESQGGQETCQSAAWKW